MAGLVFSSRLLAPVCIQKINLSSQSSDNYSLSILYYTVLDPVKQKNASKLLERNRSHVSIRLGQMV